MFEHYIYQPFFNILVGLYFVLGRVSPSLADMGIAVIIFSLVIRFILLPLTFASERSEEEKKKIEEAVAEANRTYSHEPIKLRAEIKRIMRSNFRIVFSTTTDLAVQLIIILMLYRIFTTGLEGTDFHLLYSWMPVPNHINLMFLGKYDLSKTNPTLNLIQSLMIFVVELLSALRSPYPVSRKNKMLLQLILPLGSYVIFMFLPAGKKVFIITSLVFSAIYNVIKILQTWAHNLMEKMKPKPPIDPTIQTATPTPANNVPSEGQTLAAAPTVPKV